MKGLILAAGKGTRLRPLTYTQPKPFLPVANKSVIQYGIESLVRLGIREVGIVIHPAQKELFEKHLGTPHVLGAQVTLIEQCEQKGIAHAVLQAESFINGHSFLLLLGDNLIEQSLAPLQHMFLAEDAHAAVMLAEVKNPQDYGIAEIEDGQIIGLQEKPEHPRSNLAVIGAYVFDSSIFKAIRSISSSPRGEYEITDAIGWLIDSGYKVNYAQTDQHYSDVGTVQRWLEANRWILQKHVHQQKRLFPEENRFLNCIMIPPVEIGENCDLQHSIIGPFVSVGSNVKIHHCNISNSIVLKNTRLSHISYAIKNSIFGEGVQVKEQVEKGGTMEVVLGDRSSLFIDSNRSTSGRFASNQPALSRYTSSNLKRGGES